MQASKCVDFNIKLLLLVLWLGSVIMGSLLLNVKHIMSDKLEHDNEVNRYLIK